MSFIHHFIHLYFFTEFEIFFYIYYILPYEKQLVYNMFSRDSILSSLKDENGNGNGDDNFTSLLDSFTVNNYDKQCDLEQDRIDANHNKLWTYCLIYIIIMNVLLFLFFIKDAIMCYREYNPKFSLSSLSSLTSLSSISSLSSPTFCNQTTKYKKSDFDIEMIDLEAAEKRIVTNSNNNVSYNSFCIYYWHKSEFFLATCKTVQFIILIGIFEYLFFSTIVNKYKVVSAKLLLCKLIQD